MKLTNEILEDHGDWLLIDISTPKHPDARMAVDSDVWRAYEGGRVGAAKNNHHKYIRAQMRVKGKTLRFHHYVLPKIEGLETDHIIHGRLSFIDNRLQNLRYVTSSQNNRNKRVSNRSSSGVTGVFWDKARGKWCPEIYVNKEKILLGNFTNKKDAIIARKAAERECFGEYAFERVPESKD